MSWFRRHEFGLLLAIVLTLFVITLCDQQHNYFDKPKLSAIDIIRQTSPLGIIALGAALVIIAGGIDLSAGSVIAFSGTVCATIMFLLSANSGSGSNTVVTVSPGVIAIAIAGTLLVGGLIGTLHAWLITSVGLPPFIATLGTLVGLRSFARALIENVTQGVNGSRSTQISISARNFRELGTSVWIPALVLLVLAGLTWLLLSRTVTGRHIYALGGNETAAKLSGIRTDRIKWLVYVLSSLMSSIAGIFYIGDQSVADPQTLGVGYELNAIASAVVGGCSLQGGVGTIPGTFLGALFLRIVMDGVAKIIKTGADVYEGLIVGGVVVLAVAFTQSRGTSDRRSQLFTGPLGLTAAVAVSLFTGILVTMLTWTIVAHPKVVGAATGSILLLASVAPTLWRSKIRPK